MLIKDTDTHQKVAGLILTITIIGYQVLILFQPFSIGSDELNHLFLTVCISVLSLYLLLQQQKYTNLGITSILIIILSLFVTLDLFLREISVFDSVHNILEKIILLIFLLTLITQKNSTIYFKKNFYLLLSFQILLGYLQFFTLLPSKNTSFPITGTFINPAPYIFYITTLYIYIFIEFRQTTNRLIFIFLTFSVLCMLIICESRINIIACSAVLITYLRNSKKISILQVKKLVLLTIVIAISILTLVKQQSSQGRFFIWKNTLDLALKNPLIGVGNNNLNREYLTQQSISFKKKSNIIFSENVGNIKFSFNIFLEYFAKYGIFTLLILFSIILNIYLESRNQMKTTHFCLLYLFIVSLGSYPFEIDEIKLVFIIFLADICSNPKRTFFNLPYFPFRIVSTIIIITSLFFTFFIIHKIIRFNHTIDPRSKYDMFTEFSKMEPYMKQFTFFSLYHAQILRNSEYQKKSTEIIEDLIKYNSNIEIWYLLIQNYEDEKKYLECIKTIEFLIKCYPNSITPKYLEVIYYYKYGKRKTFLEKGNALLNKEFNKKYTSDKYILYKQNVRYLIQRMNNNINISNKA